MNFLKFLFKNRFFYPSKSIIVSGLIQSSCIGKQSKILITIQVKFVSIKFHFLNSSAKSSIYHSSFAKVHSTLSKFKAQTFDSIVIFKYRFLILEEYLSNFCFLLRPTSYFVSQLGSHETILRFLHSLAYQISKSYQN